MRFCARRLSTFIGSSKSQASRCTPSEPPGSSGVFQRRTKRSLLAPLADEGALERSMICSNDPICADHQPGHHGGDRATHGAACHGCLLIAETSCEMRNLFLDRSLLVPTMANDGSSLFDIGRHETLIRVSASEC